MDRVEETPVKRRRIEKGYVPSQSQDDDKTQETMLLDAFETVPTIPVVSKGLNTIVLQHEEESDTLATLPFTGKEAPVQRSSSPLQSSYITQPTQLVSQAPRSGTPEALQSVVQVAASSPAVPSPCVASARPAARSLAVSMAPPGTQFRAPVGARPAQSQKMPGRKVPAVEIPTDDEGPRYVGGSSDDEKYNRDIKPTVIKSGSGRGSGPQSTQSSFDEVLAKFRLSDRLGSANNSFSKSNFLSSSADPMANAYGSSSRPPRAPLRQTGPSRAQPVQDISLNEIPDFQDRKKVEQMTGILPKYTARQCYDALLLKKHNQDDAMDWLAAQEMDPGDIIVIHSDEDELASAQAVQPRKHAKQQVRVNPKQTIQQRYAAKAGHHLSQVQTKDVSDSSTKPQNPRRRLVKGRKHASPPSSPAVTLPPKPARRFSTPISLDSGSEEASEAEPDPVLDGSLLKFFNTCSVDDLVDLASVTKEAAQLVLSHRPFRNLNQVRNIVEDVPSKPGAKRKAKPRAVGEKIVDTCETMWTGYEAVDELVKRCEALGQPLVEEMKKWGVSVFGAGQTGELEVVNFSDSNSESSHKDSGIGTPRSSSLSDNEGVGVKKTPKRHNNSGRYFPQPAMLAPGVVLKDYQVVGINWLSLLFKKELSCILADDMGLGKTCQVISFLAHLKEIRVKGPHVIVVPSSVLENWLREFETFCPDLLVMPYHGSKAERVEVQQQIADSEPYVVVTTYNLAKKPDDRKFFKWLKPVSCIFDEGHTLKNPKSEQYKELMKIPCRFRLLLTGTPLQNNLGELIALLGFMMPQLFKEHQEELKAIFNQKATTNDEQHQALLSAQRIARAKSMMTPFILRRKKHQVLKDIPAKHRRVQYCDMSKAQEDLYTELTEKYREMIRRREAGEKISSDESTNAMMSLRKAALHPLLFRRHYHDDIVLKMAKACTKEEQFAHSNPDIIYEELEFASDMELHRWCSKHVSTRSLMLKGDEWMDAGKVTTLVDLLLTYRAAGDRVLIFSQFVMVLDILEEVLETINMKFARLDGSVDINSRQELIDTYYADTSITAFILSTKAGGAGVNLACANKVVIFDGSFNPQDDVQAENRAHRVGQTREVEVVRLVTRGTIEEKIHALGETKLALDERVVGEAMVDDVAAKKVEKAGEREVEQMMAEEVEGKK